MGHEVISLLNYTHTGPETLSGSWNMMVKFHTGSAVSHLGTFQPQVFLQLAIIRASPGEQRIKFQSVRNRLLGSSK